MNNFEAKDCWRNTECTQCYDKLSILLAKCLEKTKGSKHCYEVYKPSSCYPYDNCSVCIRQLLRNTESCKNEGFIIGFACILERPSCMESCREKIN